MAQAPSVALPQRFPLIVQPENRNESPDKDAKLLNGYMEKGRVEGEYWVYKRPGLISAGPPQVGAGLGVYNWQGNIYAIFGSTLYRYSATSQFSTLTATPLGTVGTAGGQYRFSSSLGGTPRLQLGNGLSSYNYDPVNGLVPISGINFPTPPVKGFAYLDGTTYVMAADAYIHGSETVPGLNRPDLWGDALNVIGAQMEPDPGVFLAKQLAYVLALKQWSTEVFYNAQNEIGASPLGPVQGAKMNYGCVSADSVQEIDGSLLWLATNRSSAVQVILVEALKPVVVSTKAVERLLGEADFTAITSMGVKYEGHRFYILTLKNSNLTLVYDLTDQMWAQWTDPAGNYFKGVANTYYTGTARIIQHESNGQLYLMGAEYPNDNGEMITVDLYTPNFDGGVRRRKQVNSTEFIGDQTPGSQLQVRVNDADYDATKWSNFRIVDMEVKKPVLMNCGTFMRRAMHIRHQCNTAMRLQAVEMSIDMGTL